RRIDHVDHHESGRDVALPFSELGDRRLEPVSLEDSPADDQNDQDAPCNRGHGKNQQWDDVVGERAQRKRADRADDDPIDRESSETLDSAAVDGPSEAVPDRGKLNEDAAHDCEREQWKLLEKIRAKHLKDPTEELEEHESESDRNTKRHGRCCYLA